MFRRPVAAPFTAALGLMAATASPLAMGAAVSLATISPVVAACQLVTSVPGASGNNPPPGSTVNCVDNLDSNGVVNAVASGVTVNVESPAGGISTTGQPGVLLGDGATITVTSEQGSNRPINTSGDMAAGIDVKANATITVDGQVATAGGTSPAIRATDNASITVGATGTVRTGGGMSAGIQVGANSTVTLRGEGGDKGGRVATGNSNSDAIVLGGRGSTLTVGSGAIVTTSSGMSNPVQVDGADATVNVSGRVQSSSGDATAILGTADGLMVNVRDGGFVTAQSSGSNAIEAQGANAQITVERGGEVSISSGNSVGIVSGDGGTVTVEGTVKASSSQSQGVVLGDGATLNVGDRGVIETSSSESQAVLIGMGAATATVNVRRGGNIDAVGAQAVVDRGMTDTTVTVDGRVFGGSSDPVLDMGDGDDTVTVNGTVEGSSADPVIDLGAGDDTLNNNSSETISGPGVLAVGGAGNDTLNLANGSQNRSSRYSGFETTNVGRNRNANDPANGMESTLTVDNDQSGNTINANEGGRVDIRDGRRAGSVTVNANSGGTVGLTADNGAGTGSGQGGGTFNFAAGSTADVSAGGASRERQSFSGTTFGPGTRTVVNNSDFLTGTAAGNAIDIGLGQGAFANAAALRSAGSVNAAAAAGALDAAIAANPAVLDAAIAGGRFSLLTTGAATADVLRRISGEIGVQTAGAGILAAGTFADALRPGGVAGSTHTATFGSTVGVQGTDLSARSTQAATDTVGSAAVPGVWVAALGSAFDVESSASGDYDGATGGLVLGLEGFLDMPGLDGGTAGIAVGYTDTQVDGVLDDGDARGYHVGAYISGRAGGLTWNGALSYSHLDLESGIADGDANVFSGRAEAAYDLFALGTGLFVAPVARLGFTHADVDGFGALGPLGTVVSGDFGQGTAAIGLRMAGWVGAGTLRADAFYEHTFGDARLNLDATVLGTAFTTGATVADENRFRLGLGYDVQVGQAQIGARYDGAFGEDVREHTGSVKVTFRF